jgi:hypothetical protein
VTSRAKKKVYKWINKKGNRRGGSVKELYEQYGKLMIQLEILNGQIQQVKQQIAQGLNEKPKPEVVKEP